MVTTLCGICYITPVLAPVELPSSYKVGPLAGNLGAYRQCTAESLPTVAKEFDETYPPFLNRRHSVCKR